jgi:uncharacterized membrane protein (UPF0127 family)
MSVFFISSDRRVVDYHHLMPASTDEVHEGVLDR